MWTPPVELSPEEEALCARMTRTRRLFPFLRHRRHELFDEATQKALEAIRRPKPRGKRPKPAAQLALAVLLQAAARCSDDEVVHRAHMDRAWQMVLGTLGETNAPFGKATFVDFRAALIEHGLDRVLLARSVELARASRGFDPKALGRLRIALDSAPLEGAGRVEDTLNLLGRALGVLVRVLALLLMLTPEELVRRAGLTLVGASSVKAALDVDWTDADARHEGLRRVLAEAERLEAWVREHAGTWVSEDRVVDRARRQFQRFEAQDTELGPDGQKRIRQGVAPDRQISLHDPDMRHGRKTDRERIDGYKRYEAIELDSGAALEACVLPANRPEHEGADKLAETVRLYGPVDEVHVDRAFLPSGLVAEVHARPSGRVVCRPYAVPPSERFTKRDFAFDVEQGVVRCPAGQLAVLQPKRVHFAAGVCAACPLQAECQAPGQPPGRTLTVSEREPLLQALAARSTTSEGRAELRERVASEHGLAHLIQRQGRRARYLGVRKNDFDARRAATVNNLHVAERAWRAAA